MRHLFSILTLLISNTITSASTEHQALKELVRRQTEEIQMYTEGLRVNFQSRDPSLSVKETKARADYIMSHPSGLNLMREARSPTDIFAKTDYIMPRPSGLNLMSEAKSATGIFAESERLYNETGALPSTQDDWERVGISRFSSSKPIRALNNLVCRLLSSGSHLTSELSKLPKKSPTILMSEVKDQGYYHGFCTAFAVCACAEAVTGETFSESELILRLKTMGGDDRTCDGSHLYLYPNLLREGLVFNEKFPKYEAFELYVRIRKNQSDPKKHNPAFQLLKPSERFCDNDAVYRDAITAFRVWCKKANQPMPETMKPSWGPGLICEENYKGALAQKYPQFKDSFKERPNTGFLVEFVDGDSYYTPSFSMWQVAVFEPHHPSRDPLHSLKVKLFQGTPIALSIKTFAKYKLDATGEMVIEETWPSTAPKSENNYKIHLPPPEYVQYGGHAICICGYDDAKNAFYFKNSWGADWGNKGYAWLSYDYVAQHAFMNDAFSIEIDRR